MKILLSWSGTQSKAVASALRSWLPAVLPGLDPWMSQEDISKGRGWFVSLLEILADVDACVICITPENAHAPWIHFEAGAIASKKDDAHVFSYLVGVSGSVVSPTPLGQYQWTICDKDDTWRLVKSINKALGSGAHDESLLETQFKQKWRQLKQRIEAVLQEQKEVEEKLANEQAAQEEAIPPRETVFHPTPDEVDILLKTSESQLGYLNFATYSGGCQIIIEGEQLIAEEEPRRMMRWREAIERLLTLGLLKDVDHNGEVLHLTSKGYDAADQIRRHQQSQQDDNCFPELETMMPKLLDEMRTDFASHPLVRELVLLEKGWAYNDDSPNFRYFYEDNPELESMMQILENHGLVTDTTFNNVKRYRISEDLAKYLVGTSKSNSSDGSQTLNE